MHADTDPTTTSSRTLGPASGLVLASFAALYFELLLIRWIPANQHSFGYFANLVLLACFVGMGIGFARDERGDVVKQAFWRTIVVTAIIALLNFRFFEVKAPGTDVDVTFFSLGSLWRSVSLYVVLPPLFALLIYTFIPFGTMVGRYFPDLPRLRAYSLNIAGSLLGIFGFSLISYLGLNPAAWFLIGLVLLTVLMERRTAYLVGAVVMALFVFTCGRLEEQQLGGQIYWSPYYKIQKTPVKTEGKDVGFLLHVNSGFLLSGLDLRIDPRATYYDFPYQFVKPRSVLILGAGAGNDVARAVHHGVQEIDAVEIDPTVAALGQAHHPEQPWGKPGVSLHLGDARTFLSRSNKKYDLIIFATLDSHGLFSQLSSVRMENYVFTRESIAAARRLLSDRGVLVQSSGPFQIWVHLRMLATFREVFGQDALLYRYTDGSTALVAGNVMPDAPSMSPASGWTKAPPDLLASRLQEHPYAARPATDDWPYLYVRSPSIPAEYVGMLAIVLVVSTLFIAGSLPRSRGFNLHFFFLGSGFMLLETKCISEMGLLFGATWIVSSVVISAFLLVILLANALVQTRPHLCRPQWMYPCLMAALVMNFFVPLQSLLFVPLALRALVCSLLVALPIFFAASIFATSFRDSEDARRALSSNMLGAVVGGLCEYTSMVFGFRSLYLLALLMYAISLAALYASRRGQEGSQAS